MFQVVVVFVYFLNSWESDWPRPTLSTAIFNSIQRVSHLSCLLRRRTINFICNRGNGSAQSADDTVTVTFVLRDKTRKTVKGKIGDNLMYLAHQHGIEIEGACEASLACSTCHVYVDDSYYNKLSEPKEEEDDMLDMAPALKPNSRLSCQIVLSKELDNIVVTLPPVTRNFYVDGHVPTPH